MLPTPIHAQDIETLPTYTPVEVELTDATPIAQFEFEAEADSVWSIAVQTSAGDLDPVIRIYNGESIIMIANDNETADSLNARIEGWVAPEDGRYQIEVGRAGDARARTSGQAVVVLFPHETSILLARDLENEVVLEAGRSHELLRFDLDNPVLSVEFDVEFGSADAFWLRSTPLDGEAGWLMSFSPTQWFLNRDQGQVVTEENLTQALTLSPGRYRVFLEGQTISVFLNQERLFTVTTEQIPIFFAGESALALVSAGRNQGSVAMTNLVISTQYYTDATRETAEAPITFQNELTTMGATSPFETIDELTQMRLIGETRGLIMRIPEGVIQTDDVGFSSYPLQMGIGLQNFVMSFGVEIESGGAGAACGMTFRQVNGANFGSVLISEEGNAYLLDYNDGALSETSVAVDVEGLAQGFGVENQVLLIGEGEELTLFINEQWILETTFEPQAGVVQFYLSLNEATDTVCYLRDMWLWALVE